MSNIHLNNDCHYSDFIKLNEIWISKYFELEEADLALAKEPAAIIKNRGYIITLELEDEVIGACALVYKNETTFELARMAVKDGFQGRGYGNALLLYAINISKKKKAKKIELISNSILTSAIALYNKHGFQIVSQGTHPVYSRCNLGMEKILVE